MSTEKKVKTLNPHRYGTFSEILEKQSQLMDLVQKKEQDYTLIDY